MLVFLNAWLKAHILLIWFYHFTFHFVSFKALKILPWWFIKLGISGRLWIACLQQIGFNRVQITDTYSIAPEAPYSLCRSHSMDDVQEVWIKVCEHDLLKQILFLSGDLLRLNIRESFALHIAQHIHLIWVLYSLDIIRSIYFPKPHLSHMKRSESHKINLEKN